MGFLQVTGSISQSVYLGPGNYSLSFMAAQRANIAGQSQEIQVLVDGVQVGLCNPNGTQYTLYQTASFLVSTAMVHTITLVGVDPLGGDNTAFIDDLSILG